MKTVGSNGRVSDREGGAAVAVRTDVVAGGDRAAGIQLPAGIVARHDMLDPPHLVRLVDELRKVRAGSRQTLKRRPAGARLAVLLGCSCLGFGFGLRRGGLGHLCRLLLVRSDVEAPLQLVHRLEAEEDAESAYYEVVAPS